MKRKFATLALFFTLGATALFSFTTPDVVYIRAKLDRSSELARDLSHTYGVTGAGEDYLDLIVPKAEFGKVVGRLDSYELLYSNVAEKIEKTLGPGFEDDFHDYNETIAAMNQAALDHPDIVRLSVLGLSVEGRYIMGARITDNPDIEEDEPEFRVIGLHHGDELMGTEINLLLLDYLTDNYGSDPTITSLVDGVETWIIPMMNPDGRMATPYPTRGNANGVDLNRDYGYMWNMNSPGVFSQPETRAIRTHGLDNNFLLSLSFHTSGDIVNYVWNYSGVPTPDDDIVAALSQEYGSYNGYWVVHGYYWYQTYGDCNDWSYGSRSDIDWTIEVADANIAGVWNDNRDAIIALMLHANEGLTGRVTDSSTGDPVEALITVEEIGYPWYNDSVRGDYHRLLFPGTYTVTVSSPGYVDTTITGVSVGERAPTLLDVALEPGGTSYASQVTSCYFYDPFSWPNQYQRNPTNANAALGYPDGVSASLGEGGNIVLDFGADRAIPDIDGDDFTVYETETPDGYRVYLSNSFTGPWTLLGNGTGTSSFDISDAGFVTARYVKIVDTTGGDAYAWYPGADIDAVVVMELPEIVDLAYTSQAVSDTAYGNGNGITDPGETVELWVTLANLGILDATGVSALLSSPDSSITVDVGLSSYPDIPGGGQGTSITPYVLSVSPEFPEGVEAALLLEITADGGYSFQDSLALLVGKKPVLLVDDDGGESHEGFFTFALDGTGRLYDVWDVASQGSPALDDLSGHRVIVWTTADTYENTLSAADKTSLAAFLDAGGRLLLSSQDYLFEHGLDAFASDYLHVGSYTSDVSVTRITGVAGDPIGDGLSFTLGYPSGFSNFSDDLLPGAGAAGVFLNTGYGAKPLGPIDYYGVIRYPGLGWAPFKTVFFAVPFEAVPLGGYAITLMDRAVEWLLEESAVATLTLLPDTTIVKAGSTLGMQVTAANNMPSAEEFVFWTNVTLPNGATYPPSGYLLGPLAHTFDPLQTISVHLSHPIPSGTPRLTYTYNAYLSWGGDVVAEDHFAFTVTDP